MGAVVLLMISIHNYLWPSILVPPKAPIKLCFQVDKMQARIQKHITAGTSLIKAQRIMEASGFECERLDIWFPENPCLRCRAVYRTWEGVWEYPLVDDVITVHLYTDTRVITRITVSCESIGP
jgi:hypothetical protein